MREYEVVYIFRSALGAEEIDSKLEGYQDRLGDAQVSAVEHWGKRQLAYEIGGERNGYYVVAQFMADPGRMGDFEQVLKMDEDLLRHLIVLSEGEAPVPPSLRREEPEEDEDEEDEEDDEDEDEEDADEEDEDDEDEDDEDEDDEDEED